MSTTQVFEAALDLPLPERIALANRLWDSAFGDETVGLRPNANEPLVDTLNRRAAEIGSGAVRAIPHEQVMAEARRALE